MGVMKIAAAAAAALFWAGSASALETRFVSGQITGFSDPGGLFGTNSFIGSAFSTTLTFDPTQTSHVSGTDVIGTIDAGALQVLTPADAAMRMPQSDGAVFFGILPFNLVEFVTPTTTVRCGGSGGVTLRADGAASFSFSCAPFAGPTLSVQGAGTYSSAVPEPATWAMLLLGFGAVGHAVRRRVRIAGRPRLA